MWRLASKAPSEGERKKEKGNKCAVKSSRRAEGGGKALAVMLKLVVGAVGALLLSLSVCYIPRSVT